MICYLCDSALASTDPLAKRYKGPDGEIPCNDCLHEIIESEDFAERAESSDD